MWCIEQMMKEPHIAWVQVPMAGQVPRFARFSTQLCKIFIAGIALRLKIQNIYQLVPNIPGNA